MHKIRMIRIISKIVKVRFVILSPLIFLSDNNKILSK